MTWPEVGDSTVSDTLLSVRSAEATPVENGNASAATTAVTSPTVRADARRIREIRMRISSLLRPASGWTFVAVPVS